jgi:DUF4097 and DUF4098 domain-containing protein YvlB
VRRQAKVRGQASPKKEFLEGKMESNRRNVWIVVAFVLVAACCLVVVLGAVLASRFLGFPFGWSTTTDVQGAPLERAFEVGGSPRLEVDNFAGSLIVREGSTGEIWVRAIKHARRAGDLDRIQVQMSERDGRVEVKTRKPPVLGNAWVELEIVAPADTDLHLNTGSGSVEVSGVGEGAEVSTGSGSVTVRGLRGEIDLHSGSGSVTARDLEGRLKASTGSGRIVIEDMAGEIDAHTGSGSIDVRQVSGLAKLDTGSGTIEYQGSPRGDCRFETGSGSIDLRLPADLGAEVDLHTGSGSIEVGFAVVGQISKRDVEGMIGRGGDVSIYAHTGSGGIDLIRD